MKLFIPLLLIFCMDAYSQVITGKVYDSATGLPVADASVYLNNSSYYTMTNDSGSFYLKVPKRMNTPLIISRVSYETFAINDPFKQKSIEIPLTMKENVLSEVVIKADRFLRQEKLKAFKQQFLGDNKAGRSCTILNEDDIQIFFDENEKKLSATNELPIVIENKYLGYQMHCLIDDFKVRYSNNSLKARDMESVLLRCNTFFIDMASDNPTIKKRRDEAYKGSLNYFFKNLVDKTLESSKYFVYNYSTRSTPDIIFTKTSNIPLQVDRLTNDHIRINPYKYFDIIDSSSQKIVRIKSSTDINKINTTTQYKFPYPVSGIITVENSSNRLSEIDFLTDEFSVDAFGLIDKKDYVYISGQMGEQRMGSALPLDYKITSTTTTGQDSLQEIPDRLVSLFQKQLEVFPQEKIYVQTDKPYYISGEKIWFRACLANAVSHEPVSIDRYVYVELINSLDSVISRVKIRQEEKAYYGYLPIPENASEGNYTLRAYTDFMRNQNESDFFTKTILIGAPQTSTKHHEPLSGNDFDVSFFPEGGSLMQGTFCNVAFKAMKSNGQSTDISGTIYDQTGKEMKEFKSEHLGMGSFLLLAEKGKTYYAVCRNNKGELKRFDLPAAVDHGYALSVNRMKDKIYVTVLKPAEATQNEELYLLAHTRGAVHFADRWNPEKSLSIQPNQFPSGVLHLILFDAGLNPVSERLVFINNSDQTQVTYRPNQESYTPRSLVKNQVILTDTEGHPLSGNFSVAVTSDKAVSPDSTSNILTYLLLTSDLRGNIENPAYYFQNTNASVMTLDLLMLTQGWRRYNIAKVAQGRFTQPKIPIKIISEISGIVKNDLRGTPAKDMDVTIISSKNNYFDKTKTDKDGRFTFRDIEYPDSTSFIVSVKMKKTTTAKNLILDRESFPKITLHTLPHTEIDSSQFSKYIDNVEQQYVYEHGVRMIHLPEVQVSAKQKSLKKSQYYDTPSSTITKEFIENFPAPNILLLLSTIPGVAVNYNYRTKEGTIPVIIRGGGLSDMSPVLLVDDVKWDLKDIDQINPSDIAQIDIIKGANIFGMQGGGGVISIFTKTIDDYKNDDYNALNIKSISPLGYQQPVEFYAPKYDTLEKRNATVPDLRTTIYWQPVVQTDEQGEASFEFYTADESTSYTVVIEGLADDGSIIRKESKLWIKDK